MPRRITVALVALLTLAAGHPAAAQSPPAMGTTDPALLRYDPAEFPGLREMLKGFESALTSPDNGLRYRLRHQVSRLMPLPEAERLLRRMMRDPARPVAEQAAVVLATWGVPFPSDERPLHLGDLDGTVPEALEDRLFSYRDRIDKPQDPESSRAGAANGEWALALGVFGTAEDVPRVRRLAAHENVYVQFCAAKALIWLGDAPAARPVLESLSACREPYYVAHARFLLARLAAGPDWDPCRAWVDIVRAVRADPDQSRGAVFLALDPEQEWAAAQREALVPGAGRGEAEERGEKGK